MALQEKFDALKKQLIARGKVPGDVLEVILEATRYLEVSGAADRALQVGDRAPSFKLPDQDGHIVTSEQLLQHGPLVVSFFRGTWCPYCTLELDALQETLPALTAAGAWLVAISPQQPKFSEAMRQKQNLTFPILSDAGHRVANAFELTWQLPHNMQKVYLALGNDLPRYNGDTTWELPLPARFVIDRLGIIRYATVSADYTVRADPSDALAVVG